MGISALFTLHHERKKIHFRRHYNTPNKETLKIYWHSLVDYRKITKEKRGKATSEIIDELRYFRQQFRQLQDQFTTPFEVGLTLSGHHTSAFGRSLRGALYSTRRSVGNSRRQYHLVPQYLSSGGTQRYLVTDRRNPVDWPFTLPLSRRMNRTPRSHIRIFFEPNYYLGQLQRVRRDRLYSYKVPSPAEPNVGIEIECYLYANRTPTIYGTNDPGFAADFLAADLQKFVMFGTDGSLSRRPSDSHEGFELRLLAPESQLVETVYSTCDILKKHAGVVNSTCGLHVHLDCRPNIGRNHKDVYSRLVAALPLLFAMIPDGRRSPHGSDGGRYCQRNTHLTYDEALTRDRYQAINPHSFSRHSTIEVRCHPGSTNPRKILFWVALLTRIVDTPLTTFPTTLKNIQSALDLDDTLTNYIASRIEKFHIHSHGKMPFLEPTLSPIVPRARKKKIIDAAFLSEVYTTLSEPTPAPALWHDHHPRYLTEGRTSPVPPSTLPAGKKSTEILFASLREAPITEEAWE